MSASLHELLGIGRLANCFDPYIFRQRRTFIEDKHLPTTTVSKKDARSSFESDKQATMMSLEARSPDYSVIVTEH